MFSMKVYPLIRLTNDQLPTSTPFAIKANYPSKSLLLLALEL